MMHALTTPPDRLPDLTRHSQGHAGRLVSFLLGAVTSPAPAD
jgi:hypothetical protein